jgi:C1A family cysteine protease
MDEASAKEVLIKYGPITVIVDGSSNDFVQYKSGIIPACRSNMGHSVLIVGYGVENGKKFWKIQNSWGKGYGY